MLSVVRRCSYEYWYCKGEKKEKKKSRKKDTNYNSKKMNIAVAMFNGFCPLLIKQRE